MASGVEEVTADARWDGAGAAGGAGAPADGESASRAATAVDVDAAPAASRLARGGRHRAARDARRRERHYSIAERPGRSARRRRASARSSRSARGDRGGYRVPPERGGHGPEGDSPGRTRRALDDRAERSSSDRALAVLPRSRRGDARDLRASLVRRRCRGRKWRATCRSLSGCCHESTRATRNAHAPLAQDFLRVASWTNPGCPADLTVRRRSIRLDSGFRCFTQGATRPRAVDR